MINTKTLEPPEHWPSLNLIEPPIQSEQQYSHNDINCADNEYRQKCAAACGTILCMDTCIMIYENPEWDIGELTYCSSCYWKYKLYKDDTWTDNIDEIVDYLKNVEHLNDTEIYSIVPVVARHQWVQKMSVNLMK